MKVNIYKAGVILILLLVITTLSISLRNEYNKPLPQTITQVDSICYYNQVQKASVSGEKNRLAFAAGMAMSDGLSDYLSTNMNIEKNEKNNQNFILGLTHRLINTTDSAKAIFLGNALGINISNGPMENFNKQLYGTDTTKSLSKKHFIAGFLQGLLKKGQMSEDSVIYHVEERIKNAKAERYKDNKIAGERFLNENASKPGVHVLPSGLQYKVIKEGNGRMPNRHSKVRVHYRGSLIDGKEFDSSYERGKAFDFELRQVIPGFSEAITNMKEGDVWEVYIPQELGYGSTDNDNIPPFSTIIFRIELIKVLK